MNKYILLLIMCLTIQALEVPSNVNSIYSLQCNYDVKINGKIYKCRLGIIGPTSGMFGIEEFNGQMNNERVEKKIVIDDKIKCNIWELALSILNGKEKIGYMPTELDKLYFSFNANINGTKSVNVAFRYKDKSDPDNVAFKKMLEILEDVVKNNISK